MADLAGNMHDIELDSILPHNIGCEVWVVVEAAVRVVASSQDDCAALKELLRMVVCASDGWRVWCGRCGYYTFTLLRGGGASSLAARRLACGFFFVANKKLENVSKSSSTARFGVRRGIADF